MSDDEHFNLEEYKSNKVWSKYISEVFGDAAAISFVIGSEILLDYIEDSLQQLSSMPKGTHIGQLGFSMLASSLPEQFLMEYDYDFIFKLKNIVYNLRTLASNDSQIVAHSVIEELALYLIVDSAEFLMDCWEADMIQCGIDTEYWNEWIFDIFDDADIETFLYSDWYVTTDHTYHFKYWYDNQFFMQ